MNNKAIFYDSRTDLEGYIHIRTRDKVEAQSLELPRAPAVSAEQPHSEQVGGG